MKAKRSEKVERNNWGEIEGEENFKVLTMSFVIQMIFMGDIYAIKVEEIYSEWLKIILDEFWWKNWKEDRNESLKMSTFFLWFYVSRLWKKILFKKSRNNFMIFKKNW